jgi:hypothetical protein
MTNSSTKHRLPVGFITNLGEKPLTLVRGGKPPLANVSWLFC